MGSYSDFFFKPTTALMVLTIFILVYLLLLDDKGAFTKKFLHFGPGTDKEDTANFIGISMDTWQKTITLYIVAFMTSLVKTYYEATVDDTLYQYIYNKALKEVPLERLPTLMVVLLDPLLQGIMTIVELFTVVTGQLQFILPQLAGQYIGRVPVVLRAMGEKKFSKPHKRKD
jgi:hypothetical protein